jgi:hypothetical protein
MRGEARGRLKQRGITLAGINRVLRWFGVVLVVAFSLPGEPYEPTRFFFNLASKWPLGRAQ